jgi:hypothetical protein
MKRRVYLHLVFGMALLFSGCANYSVVSTRKRADGREEKVERRLNPFETVGLVALSTVAIPFALPKYIWDQADQDAAGPANREARKAPLPPARGP